MVQPFPPESPRVPTPSATDAPRPPAPPAKSTWPERPRKSTGMVVLLVVLTLANSLSLLVGLMGWADEVEHGAEMDEPLLQAFVFGSLISVVALVGIGGAWATRIWGPRLYAGCVVVSVLMSVFILHGFSPLSLIGVALAVGLWLSAESSWQ